MHASLRICDKVASYCMDKAVTELKPVATRHGLVIREFGQKVRSHKAWLHHSIRTGMHDCFCSFDFMPKMALHSLASSIA